jgi:pimeloyl-ACP methyl ester carboxylesterase
MSMAMRMTSVFPSLGSLVTPSAWLDVNWSTHQRWVRVAERWVNVIELGPPDGTPVVFVHGLGGRWQNWLENLPATAAAGYRTIAVDLPGFGESEMPVEKISIPGYGRWLEALLDALDVRAAALVGNSMGGFISAEVAIVAPPLVERLVLVSAAGISSADERNERLLGALERVQAVSAFIGGAIVARGAWLAGRPRLRRAAMWFVASHPERLSAPIAYEQIAGIGTPGFLPALDAVTDYPLRDRLPEIGCPTLLVWGRDDRIVPVRDADVFEELIPDARKVIWDDTGHVAMLEQPARFNELLGDFLAEPPGEDVDETSAAAASPA